MAAPDFVEIRKSFQHVTVHLVFGVLHHCFVIFVGLLKTELSQGLEQLPVGPMLSMTLQELSPAALQASSMATSSTSCKLKRLEFNLIGLALKELVVIY